MGSCIRYSRDWRTYNSAQTHEVTEVKALLGGVSDLINLMEGRFQRLRGRGRPRFPLGHVVFSVLLKAYAGLSSRRSESLLMEAGMQGYLRNVPSCVSLGGADAGPVPPSGQVRIPQFNSVNGFLRSEWLTPLLLELVTMSALPLRGLETHFAVDGTGLGTRIYERWLDHKIPSSTVGDDEAGADSEGETDFEEASGNERKGWVKLHLVSGVSTNMIARAAISPGNAHDNLFFRGLMHETVRHFNVQTVSADRAYASGPNHTLGDELGFEVLIPFKSNTRPPVNDGSAWSRDLKYFLDQQEEFWLAYHQRSNVESTISAMKRTIPEHLRTKEFYGQVNESLCKVVAHNFRTVAREVRMRGIELDLPADAWILDDCIQQVVEMRRPQSVEIAA